MDQKIDKSSNHGESSHPQAMRQGANEFVLEEAVYRQLIQELPVAMYVCDAHGRIQLFNEAAAQLWGRRPVVGLDLWRGSFRSYTVNEHPIPPEQCPMAMAMKQGRAMRDQEILIERPDGQRRHVLPCATPLCDANGKIVGGVNMLIDITDRRRVDERTRQAEIAQARLAAIVASSDDAIVSKTLEGIITSWNQSAERLFGYTAAEAVGQSILLIVPPDRHDEEVTILSRLRQGLRIDHFETKRRTKDGRLLDISLTVSPVRDTDGKIIGASKIARDITEKKRMDQEREMLLERERQAREEAQRVNRMKDEFLATLSHELRTPLNAVLGWAQLLGTGKMESSEMIEAGQIIERNARTQKQLIDDLLDMSRILSGKMRLDVQRVEPITFIESAIETVRPMAEGKGIRIEKVLDPLCGPISGDPARLQQVVWNLLTNAVKFTPKGGRVQVVLERVNSHLELTVSDTGQGIKPEFLPHLFNRFSQEDASTNRIHGGLGLGLAIAKQLAELHGGTIRAKSAGEGQGAAFIVSLPVMVMRHDENESRVHPRSPAAIAHEPSSTDLTGLHVLVVDDEADARALVQRLLSESGARVSVAGSANEAMSVLERATPDLIISDIGMPEIDGYDFLRMVRKSHAGTGRRIPAVALTAFARSEDRTRALRAGYIAHIAKPVEASELLATIAVVAGHDAKNV